MNKDKNSIIVLGAYGTEAKGFGTSSFFLNEKNLIDAGNIVNTLEEKSALIENLWISHSHLDHIVDIAYILDNYFTKRQKPLRIVALAETIDAIKKHYLNDIIWPDFSKIYLENQKIMAVEYIELELGKTYSLSKNEKIRAFQTDHTVASCGYIYTKDENSVLITADTYSLKTMLHEIETDLSIKSIVVECSFPSNLQNLAKESKHLTPKILFEMLKSLKRDDISLYINHIKPSYLKDIMSEIEQYRGKWMPKVLKDGDFVKF